MPMNNNSMREVLRLVEQASIDIEMAGYQVRGQWLEKSKARLKLVSRANTTGLSGLLDQHG
jgi:hypothetical protein